MRGKRFWPAALTGVAVLMVFILTVVIYWPRTAADTKPPKYPSDYAWLQRTFPYGQADRDAHLQA